MKKWYFWEGRVHQRGPLTFVACGQYQEDSDEAAIAKWKPEVLENLLETIYWLDANEEMHPIHEAKQKENHPWRGS